MLKVQRNKFLFPSESDDLHHGVKQAKCSVVAFESEQKHLVPKKLKIHFLVKKKGRYFEDSFGREASPTPSSDSDSNMYI